jgi:hypothetical protein
MDALATFKGKQFVTEVILISLLRSKILPSESPSVDLV